MSATFQPGYYRITSRLGTIVRHCQLEFAAVMVAAELANLGQGQKANETRQLAGLLTDEPEPAPPVTQAAAAQMLNVSERNVSGGIGRAGDDPLGLSHRAPEAALAHPVPAGEAGTGQGAALVEAWPA